MTNLAAAEFKSPTDPKDMVAFGHAWYEAALQSDKDTTRRSGAAIRAVARYREALPSLTGLYKTKVEKQLSEIERRKLIPAGTRIDKVRRPKTTGSNSR